MYVLFFLGKIIALSLPRPARYRFAKMCSLLQYRFSRRDRETVRNNLLPVIGPEERERYTRRVFVNFGYYLADFFTYSRITPAFLKKYVTVEGEANLRQAMARGRGVIALTAHLGNYELGGAVVALRGYPFCAVALPHKVQKVNEFFNAQRKRVGIEVIPTGIAVKRCLKRLREGKIIAFLGDRDFFGGGIATPLCGERAILPKGAAYFAQKTGAAIVPSFFVRDSLYHYRLIFEPPIFTERHMSENQILRQFAPVLERYIRAFADQWYMFGPFWEKDVKDANGYS
ncbi:MAG: hypothetical protein GF333_05715 [Candidatus Omnitrophica bacterium]|nr:hypothetical protein [Candidatus Omnitrophota bacterium]